MSFKRILVATDFSSCSARALELAGDMAGTTGARILLAHALEVPEEHTLLGGSLKLLLNFSEEQRKAETALRAEAKKAGVEEFVDGVVVLRHKPGIQIPEHAKETGCDLIVVGTHGRRGFRHFVLGSVAERIARDSEVPVLVVPLRE